jgi:hypothetical protein
MNRRAKQRGHVMMSRNVALSYMTYDPDAHQRLDDLAKKYGSWYLSQARAAHDDGQPVLNADGVESTLAECYNDAMVTAHALYVFLSENPRPGPESERESASRSHARPVDALDEEVDIAAGGRS